MAGLLLIGIALTRGAEKPVAPLVLGQVQLPAAPVVPQPAYPIVPSGAATVTATATATAPGIGAPAQRARTTSAPPTRKVGRPLSPARPAATPATTEPGPAPTRTVSTGLRTGATIGLGLDGSPGLRVRHRDFRGRVDRIGPDSPALSRADSRFTVRPGLADGDCVSFESANYPGRFLRHRNFEIRLDRADRTRLFAEDATFCPVAGSRTGVVALRSHNYPDHFVTESRSLLALTRTTTGAATAFAVRPPL